MREGHPANAVKWMKAWRALACIVVADARRRGAVGDLYLGSIKLPDCEEVG